MAGVHGEAYKDPNNRFEEATSRRINQSQFAQLHGGAVLNPSERDASTTSYFRFSPFNIMPGRIIKGLFLSITITRGSSIYFVFIVLSEEQCVAVSVYLSDHY